MSGIGAGIGNAMIVLSHEAGPSASEITALQRPQLQRLYETQPLGDAFDIAVFRSLENYTSSDGYIASVEIRVDGIAQDDTHVLALGEGVTVYVTDGTSTTRSWTITESVEFAVRVSDEAGGTASLEYNDIVLGDVAFPLTITSEPWATRGTYPVDVSRDDYEESTISIVPPEITGAVVIGEMPTFARGFYGTTLTGNTTYTLQIDGVDVSGFVGVDLIDLDDYENVEGDLTLIELHDGVAVHTSAALTVAAASSYAEEAATANKNVALTGAANFAADAQTILMALSFDYTQVSNANGTLFEISGGRVKLSFSGQEIRALAWDGTGVQIISQDTSILAVNDRVNVLIGLDSNGTSTLAMSINGGAWSTEWTDVNASASFNLDGPVGLMASTGGNEKAPIVHYRTAVWTGITLPDVTSATVQNNFFTGGALVDPATSIAAYGTPVMDVYGNADKLNAGTHDGSYNGGAALIISGSFS